MNTNAAINLLVLSSFENRASAWLSFSAAIEHSRVLLAVARAKDPVCTDDVDPGLCNAEHPQLKTMPLTSKFSTCSLQQAERRSYERGEEDRTATFV